MSFDLFFCWLKNERMNFDDVSVWAKGIDCFTRNDAQLWYSNPKTGVYFSFDFAAEAPESPDDAPLMPTGHFDSGLSFNLNYNRPRYFAFEAMPIVAQLASRFDLSVVDPQATGDEPELMRVVDSEALVRSWLNHNERATLTLIQDADFSSPIRMSAADSVYLWRYSKAKEDLERACGEEIFVPSLVPVRRQRSTHVGTAFTYTQGIPLIVPDSEWVILVRKKKGFSFKKREQEVQVISGQTFVELLADYIKPYVWPDPRVRIIGPESAEEAGRIAGNIERTLQRSDFDVVERDAFVDIQIPTGS
jgi:hypothetical protein